MNFVKELEWRGMIHDIMPGTEELLEKEFVTAYVGIDPTADSLHIGHLVGIMMLKHLQLSGHRPIVVLGGATGMIGDPSGKSQERNLLDEETLRYNQDCLKKQIAKFLDFETNEKNRAIMVNNYDWMSKFSFLEFIRDIGKHITVNYMMAKDSVKKRLSGETNQGMSFTEFSYQLVQAYDFLHLYRNYNCKLQMGGSDQWGNITTGTELIRRIEQGEAFALTCPLITKSDGGKFGKTESGNVWLDPKKTSPYEFYQFWLNVSDEDAEKYIKIFTILGKEVIENLILEHKQTPHLRLLQKKLAEEITVMVHSREDYNTAVEASGILFGNATKDIIEKIDENTFLSVFAGLPVFTIDINIIKNKIGVLDLLTEVAPVFPSKGELKRTIKGNGLAINKEKFTDENASIDEGYLLKNKYIIIQKGKKNYNLLICQ
ncbi:MAG TPA: tyrosine--tRNA ligase [Bacteroidales bacterium]|jgi:tyrosyl-tRNA synthetase|nr:tyrosine--tRNA ligase [Bacteroidales bacterium]HOL98658.1 tyrosine--tRNA ligase [Bacteroidales bacterium]HOM35905.1 tyrosine--tRNA ligase [Bacteroidales bacterium]HPD24477.1 tyrosine--tRNA ligase [Bacteroidales bacterium]HRT00313.1 tyrosine--tRNA ligase [Bacteroidales bacterium]